jgi:ATP-dependent phosphofructokinase / diphosphate-dependent phosphofructokinase
MRKKIRRIAVSTGGGDAPGLNAVIRAIVLAAERRGWEVVGIRKGYLGLLDTDHIVQLDRERVRGIIHLGGTILGTSNRGDPFAYPLEIPGGETRTVDRSAEVVANFERLGLDALIAIGGDGSMRIAHRLAQMGLPVVGVPKTIDNDLVGTVVTFGFDTAVTVATEAIDRLHSTAEAHERVFAVEVMGRYAGWIALEAGIAGGADVILIPEIPYDVGAVCRQVMDRVARGRNFSLVVVAEGARPRGGEMVTQGPAEVGHEVRLGGVGERVAAEIARATGRETRTVTLGHLQRGGCPTPRDRLLALRFGAAAVRLVAAGKLSVMVALDPPTVRTVPLAQAASRTKTVPLDGDIVLTAREMGLCLGD